MYISPQQNKKNNKDQQKWSTCEYDGVLFTELDFKRNMLSLLSTKISLEHIFFFGGLNSQRYLAGGFRHSKQGNDYRSTGKVE